MQFNNPKDLMFKILKEGLRKYHPYHPVDGLFGTKTIFFNYENGFSIYVYDTEITVHKRFDGENRFLDIPYDLANPKMDFKKLVGEVIKYIENV